ncbi:biotin/lipoyl-binding protein [Flavobacterium sp. FlaQc-51]|jgi:multidrug resistance efflux pump|uniref:biotin/lipoyl-binding protein n=1 Tax=unclassified Flavobacterium TaxID=196869 RepID=UPI000A4F4D3F|nr:biotin/lipoyl-binding protein [Flavobacterium sp. Leaf82]
MNFSSDPLNTLENLISKNKIKSLSIYFVVVLTIIIFLIFLPIIKVDISSQSRGIIRSKTDNVPVSAIVSGKVITVSIKNNVAVTKGDTLIIMSKENLENDKDLQDSLSSSVLALLNDVNNLLQNKTSYLSTSIAREDMFKFQSEKRNIKVKFLMHKLYMTETRYYMIKIF